jgi:hypothetical protein
MAFPQSLAVLLLLASPVALAVDLPAPWRVVDGDNLARIDGEWRSKSPNRFLEAKADFNGDGQVDTAMIVWNVTNENYDLVVSLETGSWVVVSQSVGNAGTDVTKPGKYVLNCVGDAGPPEKTDCRVALKHPGLDLFVFDAGSMLFVWDSKAKSFRRYWWSV